LEGRTKRIGERRYFFSAFAPAAADDVDMQSTTTNEHGTKRAAARRGVVIARS